MKLAKLRFLLHDFPHHVLAFCLLFAVLWGAYNAFYALNQDYLPARGYTYEHAVRAIIGVVVAAFLVRYGLVIFMRRQLILDYCARMNISEDHFFEETFDQMMTKYREIDSK